MDESFSIRGTLMSIVQSMVEAVAAFTPRLVLAIVIGLVGLAFAVGLRRALRVGLQKARFDTLLDKVGILGVLQRFGVRQPPSIALSQLVYFLVVIFVLQTAFQAVGLVTVANAIGTFFAYLPNLAAAFVVLILGHTVGQFAGRAVEQAARESGVDFAPVLGRLVTAVVLFVVVIMAVSQLDIDTLLIQRVAVVLLAGFALGFALTFGLGTRDITRNIVAGFYAKKLFQPGDEIEIQSERGILRAITPVQTLLERDGGIVALSNRVFLDEAVKK